MSTKKVTIVEPKADWKTQFRFYYIGIYARVSTGTPEQLRSLGTQVSAFMALYRHKPRYIIYDVYIDVESGKNCDRPNYKRMLDDARAGRINMIVTKSISRFGRDSLEAISTIRELRELGVNIFFQSENIYSLDHNDELFLTTHAAVAEADNQSRSENIRAGFLSAARAGTSKYYQRKCYGYTHDKDGQLMIDEQEASVVRFIFDAYLEGASINQILVLLKERSILSPTGKPSWCKRTLYELISNEKYTGRIIVGKTVQAYGLGSKRIKNTGQSEQYEMINSHPPIIPDEIYEKAQIEKARRTNLEKTDQGFKRKKSRFKSTFEHSTVNLKSEGDK